MACFDTRLIPDPFLFVDDKEDVIDEVNDSFSLIYSFLKNTLIDFLELLFTEIGSLMVLIDE